MTLTSILSTDTRLILFVFLFDKFFFLASFSRSPHPTKYKKYFLAAMFASPDYSIQYSSVFCLRPLVYFCFCFSFFFLFPMRFLSLVYRQNLASSFRSIGVVCVSQSTTSTLVLHAPSNILLTWPLNVLIYKRVCRRVSQRRALWPTSVTSYAPH